MKKIIIANWKMNPQTLAAARVILQSTEHRMNQLKNVELIVCPPFVFISALAHSAAITKLGAQNAMWQEEGAFTGEISPTMLKGMNVTHVILGHSERRINFAENDMQVNLKIKALLEHGITPVVCLGGGVNVTADDMEDLVKSQLIADTEGLSTAQIEKIIFVYEPAWAISSVKNSIPADHHHAVALIRHIREILRDRFKDISTANIKVLYGGSVKKDNAADFVEHEEISGVLVGAASLDPEHFWEIIRKVNYV